MKLQYGCQKCRRQRHLTIARSAPLVTMVDCTCGSCMMVTHAVGEIIVVRRAA